LLIKLARNGLSILAEDSTLLPRSGKPKLFLLNQPSNLLVLCLVYFHSSSEVMQEMHEANVEFDDEV